MLVLVILGSHKSYQTMTKSTSTQKGHIAIIGSGPVGLFAGWTLQNNRHAISIFEKAGINCPPIIKLF